MMKRIAWVLAAVLLMSGVLFGCDRPETPAGQTGESGGTADVTDNGYVQGSPAGQFTEDDFYFISGDLRMTLPGDAAAYTAVLGIPDSYQQSQSCYSSGLDKFYGYSGFALYTRPENGEDILYIIELSDPEVTTPKGAHVGMTMEEIEAIYGSGYEAQGQTRVYRLDDGRNLCFSLRSEAVVLIEYALD